MNFTNIAAFTSRIKRYSSLTFLILYGLSVNPLRTDIINPLAFTWFIHHDRVENVNKEREQ